MTDANLPHESNSRRGRKAESGGSGGDFGGFADLEGFAGLDVPSISGKGSAQIMGKAPAEPSSVGLKRRVRCFLGQRLGEPDRAQANPLSRSFALPAGMLAMFWSGEVENCWES